MDSKGLKLYMRLAWRNVLRNWRHSLATLTAIAAGFAAVSLFDGFIHALEKEQEDAVSTRGMLGHVLIQRKDAQHKQIEDPWGYALDAKEQGFIENFLKNDPDFVRRVRSLSITGLITNGRSHTIFIGWGFDVLDGAEMRG